MASGSRRRMARRAAQRFLGLGGGGITARRAMALARHSASWLTVLGGRSSRVSVSSSFCSFVAGGLGAMDFDTMMGAALPEVAARRDGVSRALY
jgi:hypothetical protein